MIIHNSFLSDNGRRGEPNWAPLAFRCQTDSNASLFEVKLDLTFMIQYGILISVPMRNTQYSREAKRPWHRAKALHWYNPEGELMQPMKKPVRLLGMVFQIDK